MNRLSVLIVAGGLLIAACTGSQTANSGDRGTTSSEPIPTEQLSNSYFSTPANLAELAEESPEVVVATLTGLNPEVWVLNDPEDPSGLEDVYKGAEFVVEQGLKGELEAGDVLTVRNIAARRDPGTKKVKAYVVSDAWQFVPGDIGKTFALFLEQFPPEYGGPDLYRTMDGRYGVVEIRDNGMIKVHRPNDPLNPWLTLKNAQWSEALEQLGLP